MSGELHITLDGAPISGEHGLEIEVHPVGSDGPHGRRVVAWLTEKAEGLYTPRTLRRVHGVIGIENGGEALVVAPTYTGSSSSSRTP